MWFRRTVTINPAQWSQLMAALDTLNANLATGNDNLTKLNATIAGLTVPAAGVPEADVQAAADTAGTLAQGVADAETALAAKFPAA